MLFISTFIVSVGKASITIKASSEKASASIEHSSLEKLLFFKASLKSNWMVKPLCFVKSSSLTIVNRWNKRRRRQSLSFRPSFLLWYTLNCWKNDGVGKTFVYDRAFFFYKVIIVGKSVDVGNAFAFDQAFFFFDEAFFLGKAFVVDKAMTLVKLLSLKKRRRRQSLHL